MGWILCRAQCVKRGAYWQYVTLFATKKPVQQTDRIGLFIFSGVLMQYQQAIGISTDSFGGIRVLLRACNRFFVVSGCRPLPGEITYSTNSGNNLIFFA